MTSPQQRHTNKKQVCTLLVITCGLLLCNAEHIFPKIMAYSESEKTSTTQDHVLQVIRFSSFIENVTTATVSIIQRKNDGKRGKTKPEISQSQQCQGCQ